MMHKKIKVPCEGAPSGYTYLFTKQLAESAVSNNIDIESFKATIDKFSNESRSSIPQIREWRDEVTDIYFELMKKEGKLKMDPISMFNGSDYEDPEGKQYGNIGTTPDKQ